MKNFLFFLVLVLIIISKIYMNVNDHFDFDFGFDYDHGYDHGYDYGCGYGFVDDHGGIDDRIYLDLNLCIDSSCLIIRAYMFH